MEWWREARFGIFIHWDVYAQLAGEWRGERIDSMGYPRGIDASSLSFYTRITSIVDAYDAMTSNRTYARQKSSTAALTILYDQRGKQFD